MILPWEGFNGAPKDDPRFVVPKWNAALLGIAAAFHPAWSILTDTVKCLIARNGPQVIGMDGDPPSDMIICWTPNGKASGGTGQAIRIAKHQHIPVFNLYSEEDCKHLVNFVAAKENQ